MGNRFKEEYLKKLQKYDIPAIANATETFDIRSKIEVLMSPNIKCILPDEKTFKRVCKHCRNIISTCQRD